MAIELKPVTSSNLAAWGYDPEQQLLAVQFKNSTDVHHHEGVEPEKVEDMAKAESIGSFYAKSIRGHYKHIPPVKAG